MAKALALWALSILALQASCFSANAEDDNVTVVVRMWQHVQFGQQVKMVGNGNELYNWNYTIGPGFTWNTNDNWIWVTELPKGKTYEYKAVVVDYDTNKKCYCWQSGSNRNFTIPAEFHGVFYHEIIWNPTAGHEVDACSVGAPCATDFISTVV